MFVQFDALRLDSAAQIKRAFDVIHHFWTRECGGKKIYCVIDYTDFSLDIALTEIYAASVKHAVETYSITTVRYTNNLAARATLRAVAVKTHLPSNVYATRQDAIAVVRGLRANKIQLGAP